MSSTNRQISEDFDAAIVDSIVRQVMERLLETGVGRNAKTATSTKAASSGDGTIVAKEEPQSVLVLNEKVLTTEKLRGQLSGKTEVVVRPGTVITPAVYDELKLLGISLKTQAKGKGGGGSTFESFCLARLADHFVPVEWLKELGLGSVCCAEDYSQMGQKLDSDHHEGKTVCFAAQPYVAVSLLNRNRNLRAAFARNAKEINEIKSTLNANVLVLDSVQSRKQLAELIRIFVKEQNLVNVHQEAKS